MIDVYCIEYKKHWYDRQQLFIEGGQGPGLWSHHVSVGFTNEIFLF